MTDNKFRAVLTIYGTNKLLELRFNDLNELKTQLSVNINPDNRHKIDPQRFTNAFFNLTSAINHYAESLKAKIVIGKRLGMI